jgi:nucleotidyltransferase/DNA polymerase involved in DNA repair
MKRVVSLYLPDWSIDRLRRLERRHAPSAEAESRAFFDAFGAEEAAERAQHCSVPKEGGWRPGARWAKSERSDVEAAIEALPQHQRPPQRELGRVSVAADNPFRKGLSRPPEERVAPPVMLRELSRRTEAADHPFRAMPVDEVGRRVVLPPLQFPGEDAPNKAGRGAALRGETRRDRYRNEAPQGRMSIQRAASLPPVQYPGEDMAVRRAQRAPKRSARDGHGGEAGYIAPPSLAQLAAMPSVQFPGEGPHPDNHGKSEPTAPTYGQGRFFQTGRTLGSVVARVCRDEELLAGPAHFRRDEPPLVTTHKVGPRVEIAAVNPAARALGLAPGTALTMARAQVPGLEVRAADPDGDAVELKALAELIARRWAPTVAISDPDGLFIDLTGVAHLHGGEASFARRLVRLLARYGVLARVAIADTTGAAWALARFGGAVVSIAGCGDHAEALSELPVAALRLDAASLELLARLGIDTVGQLLVLPRGPLVRRFGPAIAARLDQATGRVPEPLDPVVPAVRILVEQRFAEPIATADAIEHWLRALMPRLARALAEAGQGARVVELVAARVDGVPQQLRLGFARPTRDPAHMLRLALRRIEEIEPGYGIDALALHVRRADPLGPESLAPALAGQDEPDLAPLVDALANRIGIDRLWRVAAIESDVPERSIGRAPPLDPPAGRSPALQPDDVRRLDDRAPDHPWHPRWPRPVRLLRRPEELNHVIAELPDQPPRRFTWRGKTHRVVRAEGPERIAGEWWRRSAERHAVRDYFRVEVEGGQRFWLYRRGDGVRTETGDLRWFMQGR